MTQLPEDLPAQEPNDVETIVRTWFRAYAEKDFATHNALIHPDAVVVYPEMCFVDPDLSAGKGFLEKTLEHDERNFLDLRMDIERLSVIGATAFVEGRFTGGKLGGEIVDHATGSEINLRFLHRIDIEDGMIKLVHAYYDTALLYQIQLGLDGPTKENPITPWMLAMAAGQAPTG